ncbi:MAG: hypothetical protein Q4B96_06990 [Bacillota bacterium]|nr:hypothetical protein [Bacillota bacterium]
MRALRKTLAVAGAALLLLLAGAAPAMALSAHPDVKIQITSRSEYPDGGVEISFRIQNTGGSGLTVTRVALSGANGNSTIELVDNAAAAHTVIATPADLAAGGSLYGEAVVYYNSAAVSVDAYISDNATEYRNISQQLSFGATDEDSGDDAGFVITSTPGTGNPLYYSGANGLISGNPGEVVNVQLKLRLNDNTGWKSVESIRVEPQLSTDVASWPFEIMQNNYAVYPSFANGEAIVNYQFTISQKAAAGSYALGFDIHYTAKNRTAEQVIDDQITLYAKVLKDGNQVDGVEEEVSGSTPKLIISGYEISPEKVYAGDSFTMGLTFRNTSSMTIRNLTISITNSDAENSYAMPAENGSNTIYIDSIPANSSVSRSLKMLVRPDAPAKPNMMVIEMDYENAEAASFSSTEHITIPIAQAIRLRIGELSLDDSYIVPYMPVYAGLSVINMGKSSVYNLMATVAGDNVALSEDYYVGTLSAGNQTSIDLELLSEQAGEAAGEIVLSYEDEYGELFEERIPFDYTIQEEMIEEFPDGGEWEEEMPSGLPLGAKLGIGAAGAAALIVTLIALRKRAKRKRQRELEEDE